ncbi:sulfurtransferase complex subunit TusC [Pseudomonadales bacterium]|nr:sulfurtransferase complex subunit TusC [Pseudomonadales bacterium]MDA9366029.1 sulfurtransferase complex subunit TusC [Pseudomonadales bacterium]MDB4150098.1 sulfurtransferase complex subunit TusC [Pseudomonadales bacterium]MDB9868405.1 sulfurtransferase complex subunit TusC [Pseudomonadales bacterium]MDB9917446.1 sulfurtransferase complex subunit TusC [Pseudomonadales bacterium]
MKKLLFVQSHPPHGSLFGQEGLDAILAGSAFIECGVLFLGDGIYQLLKEQQTTALASKNFSVSYQALQDYGVESLFCSAADLLARNLTVADLIVTPTVLDATELAALLRDYDGILDF